MINNNKGLKTLILAPYSPHHIITNEAIANNPNEDINVEESA
jgi:hypothetical protein